MNTSSEKAQQFVDSIAEGKFQKVNFARKDIVLCASQNGKFYLCARPANSDSEAPLNENDVVAEFDEIGELVAFYAMLQENVKNLMMQRLREISSRFFN